MANSGELNPLQWNYKSVTTYLGMGFGAIMGGVVGAGIATPGSVVFAGGISTPYLSAGLAVGAVGKGSNWKFDFHWTIERLALKDRPGNGFMYQLEAITDGYYKNVRTNEMVYLKEGEVWKYGETTQGEKRYSKSSYEKTQFKMQPIFYGTKTEILIQEKIMLFWYFAEHHQLPPGNKRFH